MGARVHGVRGKGKRWGRGYLRRQRGASGLVGHPGRKVSLARSVARTCDVVAR